MQWNRYINYAEVVVNMSKEYSSESIQVLDDLQHIRLRRGMYIGDSVDPRQLLSEIIDNAIDEVQAGYSNELIVNVNNTTNEYLVRDFGRGIPHGKKKLESGEEKEILEILMTKSNSGGKFNNDSYNYSAGLNGLGMTVTNALSEYMQIISYRKGRSVMAFCKGDNQVKLVYGSSDNEPDGTEVKFKPNKEYFRSAKIPIDFISPMLYLSLNHFPAALPK